MARSNGLLGANDNGGESTLIKKLSCAFPSTGREVIWRGEPVTVSSPKVANVATIPQHMPLVPTLSVIENVFLRESGPWQRAGKIREQFSDLS